MSLEYFSIKQHSSATNVNPKLSVSGCHFPTMYIFWRLSGGELIGTSKLHNSIKKKKKSSGKYPI